MVSLSPLKKIHPRLMEKILLGAKELTYADGGTLYTVDEDRHLHFAIIHTDSMNIAMGGSTGIPIKFDAIPLLHSDGTPNDHMVVVKAVLEGRTFNIPDAYRNDKFDFSGTKAFDKETGYHSISFLTVPLKNHEDEIIGVLQLINAIDSGAGDIIAFSADDQKMVESLASQAAIAMTTDVYTGTHDRSRGYF